MSFITSPKLIYDKMKEKQLSFYQVFDSDGKTLLDEIGEDDEGANVEDSINGLTETLTNISGVVYVVLRKTGTSRKRKAISESETSNTNDLYKGIYKYTIKLGGVSSEQNNSGNSFTGGGTNIMFKMLMDSMEQRHQMQLTALSEKNELMKQFDDLKAELKDKKGSDFPPELLQLLQKVLAKI